MTPAVASGHWSDPLFDLNDGSWYWGTPYVFEGWREENGGLNCSEFVCLRFEGKLGIDVTPDHPHGYTNAERIRQSCAEITEEEAGPGDLVFFERTYDTPGASHVGIVSEPGVMLDDHDRSDSGNPDGPGFTNYNPGLSDYWRGHLLGFGRVRRNE